MRRDHAGRGMAIAWATLLVGATAPAAKADVCPNEALRTREPYALRLSDCRAYEQVTPVNKDGTNPGGAENLVQASIRGNRIVFLVPANMPGGDGASNTPLFLASRDEAGWSSRGLLAPSPSGVEDFVLGWSEDLAEAALFAQMPGDSGFGVYLRDSSSGTYRELVPGLGNSEVSLAGFSSDGSHLIFETEAKLLPEAAPGFVSNLYELDLTNDRLSLAGVLPDGSTSPGGSFAGSYDWRFGITTSGGARRGLYTQNAISADGSRVAFTAGVTARLYVREAEAKPAKTIAISAGQAEWRASTPDGRYVFYTEGEDLYRFDLDSSAPQPERVTVSGKVQGTLGISADGTYVYFVANNVLASGASPGNCHGIESSLECNLYVWNGNLPPSERVKFIARQNTNRTTHAGDANNWAPGGGNEKTSRVTPDGKTLLFLSRLQLTAYNNAGFVELYRYDATRPASSGNPACVSCNPTGDPPTAPVAVRNIGTFIAQVVQSDLTHNLSDDGTRVFFETADALVPQDTNNTSDVYEWEQAGAGGCRPSSESFSASSGGCLYLISSGRSPDRSSFADASANGSDVFFFTSQPLVGQDEDQLVDVYDARVGGGLAEQNPPPSTVCQGEEECHGASAPAPVFGAPASSTFSGGGNLAAPASTPVVTPKPRALTRSQRLALALRACRRKRPGSRRVACETQARKRYGRASRAKHATGRGR